MEFKKLDGIEYDINKRWNEGREHHPNSLAMMGRLMEIDFYAGDDYFVWNIGGDGDNGEQLLYELDIYFEELDQLKEKRN